MAQHGIVQSVIAVNEIIVSMGLKDCVLNVWDPKTSEQLSGYEHKAAFTCIAVSSCAKMIAGGDEVGGTIVLKQDGSDSEWAVAKSWPSHKDEVKSMAFSPNGEMLASGGHDFTIKVTR